MWLWITVGFLVVVVVIGFLLGIVSNLKSIDTGLREANASVTGIGTEANPLPGYIQEINHNLSSIDGALKPVPAQADQILGALSSIHGSLGQVQGSLVNTSDSLVNTSGSLVDTSNSLVDTAGTLGTISNALTTAEGTLGTVSGSLGDTSSRLVTISGSLADVANKLPSVSTRAAGINVGLNQAESLSHGTARIWRQIQFLNNNGGGLIPIRLDADSILAGLMQANAHLSSICHAPVLNTLTLPGLVVAHQPCP